MSPWLFNVYMDGVVREVNARVLGRGLMLKDNQKRIMYERIVMPTVLYEAKTWGLNAREKKED